MSVQICSLPSPFFCFCAPLPSTIPTISVEDYPTNGHTHPPLVSVTKAGMFHGHYLWRAGVCILVRKLWVFPQPLLENDNFFPLAIWHFSTPIVPYLPQFFPILHLQYLTFSLLIFSFSFSFFPFCFPFLFFLSWISRLFLPLYKFFPQMTTADIPSTPSRWGGGIFQYIDPCRREWTSRKEMNK